MEVPFRFAEFPAPSGEMVTFNMVTFNMVTFNMVTFNMATFNMATFNMATFSVFADPPRAKDIRGGFWLRIRFCNILAI